MSPLKMRRQQQHKF